MSDGDGVDVVDSEAGIFESFIKDGLDSFDMRAGGDFWDDATVFGVNIYLRNNDVRQNMSAIFDNGGSGFITG